MVTSITPEEFRATDGLEDWRVDADSASITFSTPDFNAGADFVADIAAIADELDHHPDVDLRYASVTVRTTTHSEGGLTDHDVALALRITRAADQLGFAPER